MKKYYAIGSVLLFSFAVWAASTRTIDVDVFKSSDHTKTWTPPAATDTLVGRASTDTLTNKTISGGSNTLTNIPLGSAVTGTLPAGNLPNPSASTLGGIESLAAVSHNWINAISTSGVPSATQPAFTDISGTATTGQGGTGVTSVTTAPAATAFAGWDASKNLSANAFIPGYTTTATAAGTTTLTVGSTFNQVFTGSTTQTVALPVASTLVLGQSFRVINQSTGLVTVQSSGSVALQAMAANTQLTVICILTSGTGTASWTWLYENINGNLPTFNPMSAGGDIIYGGASGLPTRLANGSSGQMLTSAGSTSAPTWTTPASVKTTFIGSAQASDTTVTNTAYTQFAANVTAQMTPTVTGTYKVYTNATVFDPSSATVGLRIKDTQGSPTVLYQGDAVVDTISTSNVRQVLQPFTLYTLTANTQYTFTLQAKSSAGQVTLAASAIGGGVAIIVEQVSN